MELKEMQKKDMRAGVSSLRTYIPMGNEQAKEEDMLLLLRNIAHL